MPIKNPREWYVTTFDQVQADRPTLDQTPFDNAPTPTEVQPPVAGQPITAAEIQAWQVPPPPTPPEPLRPEFRLAGAHYDRGGAFWVEAVAGVGINQRATTFKMTPWYPADFAYDRRSIFPVCKEILRRLREEGQPVREQGDLVEEMYQLLGILMDEPGMEKHKPAWEAVVRLMQDR